MRNSILGFNQEKLLQIQTDTLKLDMSDILLMDYIQRALSQPSMKKTVDENNQPYVWLNHAKILEDLPILNIKESMLKKRISKLVDLGLIKSVTLMDDSGRGSKSYYTITEIFENLQNTETTTRDKKLSVVERPGIKNYPSDNKLTNKKLCNNKLLHNYQNPKPKQSLWDKCITMINDFTDDEILRSYLVEFLKKCLENSKEANVPFYSNTFKGKLNNLKKLSDDNYVQREIVLQTLDNGWNGFYALKKDRQNLHDRIHESGAGENIPKGDKQALRKAIEDGTAEKF